MRSTKLRTIRRATLWAAGLCILSWFAPAPTARAAGGAYAVDDVEVGAAGSCKVEAWGSFASNSDRIGVVSPACVVSLFKPVELNGQVARFRADGELGTSFTLKAKTNILPVEVGKVGVGIFGGGFFDLKSGDANGGFATIPVTFALTETFRINVNAGWVYQSIDNRHLGFYGIGFEWNFVKPLTLIGEVYGFSNSDVREPRAQAGLRFHVGESVDFDLIYGRNIAGENANWITLGTNIRFGASDK